MIKAIVNGAAGKMGGRLITLMKEAGDFELVGAIERPGHPAVGRDAGEVAGIGRAGVAIGDDLGAIASKGQLAFDFTVAAGAMANLRKAAPAGLGMVIGTTGLSAKDLEEARGLATKAPMLISSNMSVGVNIVFKLLTEAARLLGDDYDVEIVETHHHFKEDAPSGTAVKMAQVIAQALGRNLDAVATYGRKGLVGQRPAKEIGLHSLRATDVVGEHIVIFGGNSERIEIVHKAHSRDNFARGALRAARWLVGQPPGLYDTADSLGLR